MLVVAAVVCLVKLDQEAAVLVVAAEVVLAQAELICLL
jgi:hypothetical protein